MMRLGPITSVGLAIANEPISALRPRPVKGMRLAVPTTIALDDLDTEVAATFERALKSLADHGAIIERIEMAEFHDIGPMNAKGGFAASESYAKMENCLMGIEIIRKYALDARIVKET